MIWLASQARATWFALVTMLMLNGCGTAPIAIFKLEADVDSTRWVWPPPPETPRFRLVGQMTGEENFFKENADKELWIIRALKWVVGLGSGPIEPRILQRPQSGAVDNAGRIYVTDVSRQAVCVFDRSTGKFEIWEWADSDVHFRAPISIVVESSGDVLVADSALGRVARLSRDGQPKGWVGNQYLNFPTGLAYDAQRSHLYVADTRANTVFMFNAGGELVSRIGTWGEHDGQLNSPTHLSFHNDELFVSDTLNARVQVFSHDGKFLRHIGRRGLFVGDTPRPKGVSAAQNGLVYVVESYYDHLLVFNAQGEFLLPIGGTGQGPGQFYLPAGVWSDKNNFVYVADMFNGRVVVFEFLGDRNG